MDSVSCGDASTIVWNVAPYLLLVLHTWELFCGYPKLFISSCEKHFACQEYVEVSSCDNRAIGCVEKPSPTEDINDIKTGYLYEPFLDFRIFRHLDLFLPFNISFFLIYSRLQKLSALHNCQSHIEAPIWDFVRTTPAPSAGIWSYVSLWRMDSYRIKPVSKLF